MSSKRLKVPQAVIDIVMAWGTAKAAKEGNTLLSAARRRLSPNDVGILCREVAEITVETLVEVIALEDGVEPGDTVDFEGVVLLPKQAERVNAWCQGQLPIAEALGLSGGAWARLLNAGMAQLVDGSTNKNPAKTMLPSMQAAQKLVGGAASRFENPPALGTSQQTGLSGILAARTFKGDKSG